MVWICVIKPVYEKCNRYKAFTHYIFLGLESIDMKIKKTAEDIPVVSETWHE